MNADVSKAREAPANVSDRSSARRQAELDPWALLPAALFLLLVFVAVFGERIAPHEPIYYVLEHGRVVDAGTHAHLVERDGLYARLAAIQFAA